MSFRTLIAALAATMIAAPAAQAQTDYGAIFSFSGGSVVQPGYVTFDVLTDGAFRFWTISESGRDPQIYLFQGTRTSLGALVTYNDDGCMYNTSTVCPGSTNIRDALIAPSLVGGRTYTLAIGRYEFTEAEARAGQMDGGDFSGQIVINSATGTATNFVVANGIPTTTTTPEPATWALMGAGLLGTAVASRRRRATA